MREVRAGSSSSRRAEGVDGRRGNRGYLDREFNRRVQEQLQHDRRKEREKKGYEGFRYIMAEEERGVKNGRKA